MEINRSSLRFAQAWLPARRRQAAPAGVSVREVPFLGRRRLARLTIRSDQERFLPPMKRILRRFYSKRKAVEFVIEFDGIPVGYFQFNLSERETSHYAAGEDACGLEAMCVDARWQSRGIAVAALQELPRLARWACPEVRRINLTVDCENLRAISVYERAGFRQTGEVIELPGQDAQFVMSLQLSGIVK